MRVRYDLPLFIFAALWPFVGASCVLVVFYYLDLGMLAFIALGFTLFFGGLAIMTRLGDQRPPVGRPRVSALWGTFAAVAALMWGSVCGGIGLHDAVEVGATGTAAVPLTEVPVVLPTWLGVTDGVVDAERTVIARYSFEVGGKRSRETLHRERALAPIVVPGAEPGPVRVWACANAPDFLRTGPAPRGPVLVWHAEGGAAFREVTAGLATDDAFCIVTDGEERADLVWRAWRDAALAFAFLFGFTGLCSAAGVALFYPRIRPPD